MRMELSFEISNSRQICQHDSWYVDEAPCHRCMQLKIKGNPNKRLYGTAMTYNFFFFTASFLMTCQNLACDPPGWNIYNFIWHVFPENCHNTNYTVMGVVDVDIYCLLLMVVRFHALYLVYIPFQYEPHSVYNATMQWWNHVWSSSTISTLKLWGNKTRDAGYGRSVNPWANFISKKGSD